MKNRKLFEAIEKMVQEKSYDIKNEQEKSSFAANYCQRQLVKKKLIPRDPRVKMNRLMKNFQSLETFINVDQLILCLNDIHKEEAKNQQPVSDQKQNMIKEKHKRYDSEGNDNAGGMDKIRTKLKTFYRDRNIRETEKMKSVLRELETTSQLKKQKFQNNSKNTLLQIYDKVAIEGEKQIKQNTIGKKSEVWNNYNMRSTQTVNNNFVKEQEILKTERKVVDNFEEIEKQKLLSLAGTYLQMILEKHHRKKWKYQKRNEHLIEKDLTAAVLKSKQKIEKSLKKIQKPINKLSTFHTSINSLASRKASLMKSKNFRSYNHNPKTVAMKQLQTFITNLDDNQYLMKTQNKDQIGELAHFEKKISNDYEKFEQFEVAKHVNFSKMQEIIEHQK